MKKMKQFVFSPKGTLVVFGAAIGLLLLSSIGGARAALTYYSENHITEIRTQTIDVTLVENGSDVKDGVLLKNLVPKEKDAEGKEIQGRLKVGNEYTEKLSVRNSGQIDQYLRVTIYKYWVKKDASGKEVKQQQLYPGYIDLKLEDSWVKDEDASTQERTVLYYTGGPLRPGETIDFAKSLTISPEILDIVTSDKDIRYDYQGCKFKVEVDVDAVQTHNAEDAIRSAWGKDVTVNGDGSLSGIN